MCDNKNFLNPSEHFDARPGPFGSKNIVGLQPKIQASVQDDPQKLVLIIAPDA